MYPYSLQSPYLVVELLGYRLGEYLALVDMSLCLFQWEFYNIRGLSLFDLYGIPEPTAIPGSESVLMI